MLNTPEVSTMNLTGLPTIQDQEDPSISGAYLGKAQDREDYKIRRQAQSMGLEPPDPDPMAEASQALRKPLPDFVQKTLPLRADTQPKQAPAQDEQLTDKQKTAYDMTWADGHPSAVPASNAGSSMLEQAGNIIDQASTGRTWADGLADWMKLDKNEGMLSETYKSIGRFGVGVFRSFAEGTKSFYRSLDDIANGIADKTGTDRGQLFQFLVKGSDYWIKQMDKLYPTGWETRVKDGDVVSYDKFLNGIVYDLIGGAIPGMTSFALDLAGLAPVKGAVQGGALGAMEETAKVMFMDKALQASQYLPYALRAASMGGLFAADSYAHGGQSIPELTAAMGTGFGFAAMGPRQYMPEVKRITPFEAAQFPDWMFDSQNMTELARAVKAGEITPQMEQMGRYFSTIFPERDAATNLKVVNELRLASEKMIGEIGYPGELGVNLGKADMKMEGEGLKAAIELYFGADVSTVIHEHGHLYFDALPERQKAPLQEWYQKETAGDPNPPVFKEWVVDRFTDYFQNNRLWERQASPSDGFGGAFSKLANSVRGLIDKVRGVEGNMMPADVESMFRAAGTGEQGDVFSQGKQEIDPNASYQVVWHGSPHQFDKFSLEKVGTGEGNQAFGYGLYFAGDKSVAEYYRERLKDPTASPVRSFMGEKLEPGSPEYHAATLLETTGKTLAGVRKEVQGWIDNAKPGEDVVHYQKVLDTLNSANKKSDFKRKDNPGQLYEVDIPDAHNMLDWDKPLSEQSKEVSNTLRTVKKSLPEKAPNAADDLGGDWKLLLGKEVTGEQFYRGLEAILGGEKNASEYLKEIGIPGHRYLDGMSRNKGEGSYNYVLYDDAAAAIKSTSYQTKPLGSVQPEAQWENLRSWEKIGDENRPWEIVDKVEEAGKAIIKANFDPVFGALADKAVNINLTKLKTTDDIKMVISQVGEALRPEIDEARRYIQTHEMTKEAAESMLRGDLAGDLGMTEATLLQRRRGETLTPEQATASRMILLSSAKDIVNMAAKIKNGNNSNEMLLAFRARLETHSAIQAQVSGMATEAARLLNSFKILVGESDLAPGVKLNPKDVENIIKQIGGAADIERMAETLALLGETGENSMVQVNKAISGARERTWKDWLFGWRFAALLSGIPTHLRNMTGNSLVEAMAIPERAVAHKLGVISRFLGSNSPEHVELHEARAMAFGYLTSVTEAFKLAGMTFKTGESQFGPQKVEQAYRPTTHGGETKPLEKAADMLWEAMQIPTRLLGSEDEFFKVQNYRAELAAQAYRAGATEGLDGTALTERAKELMNNPTEEMQRRAIDAAKNRTFNDDMGPAMDLLGRALSMTVVGKWFVPFVRTPYNIFKYTGTRTPLAPLFKGFRDDMAAGGARAELALSQVIVGSSLMALGASLANSGIITGGGPSNPGERNVWLQNFQPYSVKVGGKWYSYGNAAEPVSTFLALAADFHDASSNWLRDWDNFGDASVWELSTALVKAFSKNITDKTFLKGITDLVHALDDPDRYAENILNSGMGSLVPAYLGNWANSIDPEIKMVGGVLDALNNRIPWMKNDLPTRRNLWGEPILSTEVGPAVAWWSPIKIKSDNVTEIDKEMLRLGMSVQMPDKKPAFSGISVELTPEEYSRYLEIAGQEMTIKRHGTPMTLKDHLNDLVESPAYQRLVEKSDGPDGMAALKIREVIGDYYNMARRQMLQENPRIQEMVRAGIEDKIRGGGR